MQSTKNQKLNMSGVTSKKIAEFYEEKDKAEKQAKQEKKFGSLGYFAKKDNTFYSFYFDSENNFFILLDGFDNIAKVEDFEIIELFEYKNI